MKRLLLPTLISCFTLLVNAQTGSIPDYDTFWTELQSSKVKALNEKESYQGSPYLFEIEGKACILKGDSPVIDGLTMRYNAYKDQVEFEKNKQYFIVPKEDVFSSIQLGDKNIELKVYQQSSKKKRGYFVPKVKGKINLYARYKVILNEPEEPGAFKDAKPAAFHAKPPIAYIDFGNGVLLKIDSKKELLKRLPDHTKELSTFIKENKTKFRKVDEVTELIKFYNTL